MRKPRILNEILQMKYEDVYTRYREGSLSVREASELLHISERTFYRKKHKYEEEGLCGVLDRRLGNTPPNKISVDVVEKVLSLRSEEYGDFTSTHFYEYLRDKHNYDFSYSWLTHTLRFKGISTNLPKRKKYRKKREKRPNPGMLIHQDGSTHSWLHGKGMQDLIVTMDDATNEIYSIFLCQEEGTDSSLLGIKETIIKKGMFCSFYTDRGSHYFNTVDSGGKVDKSNLTQVGRALSQLGVNHIPSYSPQARGRSERMFGTLQKRLPQELDLRKISNMDEANKFIKNEFLPKFNKKFMKEATKEGTAFMPYVGRDVSEILCRQYERTVNNDNTVSFKNKILQIPEDKYQYHYVKCKVLVHHNPDGTIDLFYGPRKIAQYDSQGKLKAGEQVKEKAA